MTVWLGRLCPCLNDTPPLREKGGKPLFYPSPLRRERELSPPPPLSDPPTSRHLEWEKKRRGPPPPPLSSSASLKPQLLLLPKLFSLPFGLTRDVKFGKAHVGYFVFPSLVRPFSRSVALVSKMSDGRGVGKMGGETEVCEAPSNVTTTANAGSRE